MTTTRYVAVMIIVFGAGVILGYLKRAQSGSDNPKIPLVRAPQGSINRSVGNTAKPLEQPAAHSTIAVDASATQVSNQQKLQQAFAEHPEYKTAYYANLRRLRLQAYGDLATLLNLDKETARYISDLLVEKAISNIDVNQLPGFVPGSVSPTGIEQAHRLVSQDIDNDIKQHIGEEKYELLQLVPGILKCESAIVSDYAVDFRSINEPLTAEQTRALAVVMAKNLNWNRREFLDGPSSDNQFLLKSEASVLEGAVGILSDGQISALKRHFEDKNIEKSYARQYFPQKQ